MTNLKIIRPPAGDGEFHAVKAVVTAAFGRADEAGLVDGLRADNAVVCELVAMRNDSILGHVLFSALGVEPAGLKLAALAPVSVLPTHQREGLGTALIEAGHDYLRQAGWDGVAVLGDPAYYRRFGFTVDAARNLSSEFSGQYYQALEFQPDALDGGPWRITYPRAFGDL